MFDLYHFTYDTMETRFRLYKVREAGEALTDRECVEDQLVAELLYYAI